MQLWITSPGVPVVEARCDHATDVLLNHPAITGAGAEHCPFAIPDDVLQRRHVRPIDRRLSGRITHRPGHTHGLRGAERQVEPGHWSRRLPRPAEAVDAGGPSRPRRPAQLLAGDRVLQHPQHPEEVLLGHRGPGCHPLTRIDTVTQTTPAGRLARAVGPARTPRIPERRVTIGPWRPRHERRVSRQVS